MHAGKGGVVDDAPIRQAVGGLGAVELLNGLGQFLGELGQGGVGAQHIVGGHTGLSGVHELAPGDPAGRRDHLHGVVNVDGRLSAQLQRHRCEVFGGGGHDNPAYSAVSGVEDVVEALLQQGGGFGHTALHNGHGAGKVLAESTGPARLNWPVPSHWVCHHRVAGCERADDGCQEQLDGVVPRCDD